MKQRLRLLGIGAALGVWLLCWAGLYKRYFIGGPAAYQLPMGDTLDSVEKTLTAFNGLGLLHPSLHRWEVWLAGRLPFNGFWEHFLFTLLPLIGAGLLGAWALRKRGGDLWVYLALVLSGPWLLPFFWIPAPFAWTGFALLALWVFRPQDEADLGPRSVVTGLAWALCAWTAGLAGFLAGGVLLWYARARWGLALGVSVVVTALLPRDGLEWAALSRPHGLWLLPLFVLLLAGLRLAPRKDSRRLLLALAPGLTFPFLLPSSGAVVMMAAPLLGYFVARKGPDYRKIAAGFVLLQALLLVVQVVQVEQSLAQGVRQANSVERCDQPPPVPRGEAGRWLHFVDFPQRSLSTTTLPAQDPEACLQLCRDEPKCLGALLEYTTQAVRCHLKGDLSGLRPNGCCDGQILRPPPEQPNAHRCAVLAEDLSAQQFTRLYPSVAGPRSALEAYHAASSGKYWLGPADIPLPALLKDHPEARLLWLHYSGSQFDQVKLTFAGQDPIPVDQWTLDLKTLLPQREALRLSGERLVSRAEAATRAARSLAPKGPTARELLQNKNSSWWSLKEADFPAGNLKSFFLPVEQESRCRAACEGEPECLGYVYERFLQNGKSRCNLKQRIDRLNANGCCASALIKPRFVQKVRKDTHRLWSWLQDNPTQAYSSAQALFAALAADLGETPSLKQKAILRSALRPAPVLYKPLIRPDWATFAHKLGRPVQFRDFGYRELQDEMVSGRSFWMLVGWHYPASVVRLTPGLLERAQDQGIANQALANSVHIEFTSTKAWNTYLAQIGLPAPARQWLTERAHLGDLHQTFGQGGWPNFGLWSGQGPVQLEASALERLEPRLSAAAYEQIAPFAGQRFEDVLDLLKGLQEQFGLEQALLNWPPLAASGQQPPKGAQAKTIARLPSPESWWALGWQRGYANGTEDFRLILPTP